MTIREKIAEFIVFRKNSLQSVATVSAYEETLEDFFFKYLPNVSVDALTLQQILGYAAFKQNNARTRAAIGIKGAGIGRELSRENILPATMNRHYSAIRQFLIFCGYTELSKQIKSQKKGNRFDVLEFEDIKKVFDEQIIRRYYVQKIKHPERENSNVEFYVKRMLLLNEFIFSNGLRIAEVFNLKKSDLKISRVIPVIEVIGKGNKTRVVELSAKWYNEFEAFANSYPHVKASEYLFTTIGGGQLAYSTLKTYIFNIGKFLHISRLSAHKLRHCYALKLYERDKDLVKLKNRLGHSSLDTTAIYLSHVIGANDTTKSPFDTMEE